MKILIESIPHAQQRYSTCGDWWFENGDGMNLQIRVSEELPHESKMLVALHELAEVMMCMANGVNQEAVDKFDIEFEKHRHPDDDSEPGDHIDAPYHREHGFATAIERIAATEMGIGWLEHDKAIMDLP
jgi:hypothetical protein